MRIFNFQTTFATAIILSLSELVFDHVYRSASPTSKPRLQWTPTATTMSTALLPSTPTASRECKDLFCLKDGSQMAIHKILPTQEHQQWPRLQRSTGRWWDQDFSFLFLAFVFTFEIFHSFQQKRREKQNYFSKGKNALCKYEDFEILNLLNATISTCQSSPIWLGHLCPLITYFYSLVLFIGWMRMPSTALPSFSQPSMRSLQGTKRKKFSIIESL